MDNYVKPAPDTKEARRRFSRIGVAATLMLLMMIGLPILIYKLVEIYSPGLIGVEWFSWVLSSAPMYLVAMPVFLIILRPIPKSAPGQDRIGGRQWFMIIAASATLIYAGSYTSSIFMGLIEGLTGLAPKDSVTEVLLNSNTLITLAVVGIIAPIAEELIFRKAILDRTRQYGEKTAIFFSALVFALFHGNFYQFFYAFGTGVIFAYIYLRSGRIRNTIFLHMGINLTNGVFMAWLSKKIMETLPAELADAGTLQDILSNLTEEKLKAFADSIVPALPYMAAIMLYSMTLFSLAITGLVLLIVHRKKIKPRGAELELPREAVGSVVYMNVGIASMIIVSAIVMVLSLM